MAKKVLANCKTLDDAKVGLQKQITRHGFLINYMYTLDASSFKLS
jgi:hypothetical protein